MAYATDADLVARISATSTVPAATRALALADAEEQIDDRVFGGMTVLAHVLLAAHLLQENGDVPGGSGGIVTARSAGEISVSYAAPAEAAVGLHATTAYGRRFDAIAAKAGHTPLTDLPGWQE